MTNSSNGEGIFKELLETCSNTYTPIEWEGYTPYDKLPPREPLKQRKEVEIDTKILDRYVGRYSIPPHTILKITRGPNGHLIVQENDETPQELVPQSDRTFFSTTSTDESVRRRLPRRNNSDDPAADGKDIPIKKTE